MKTQGSYSNSNKDYHLVSSDELIYNPDSEDVQARVSEEFRMRVEVANERFRNTYDWGHAKWMCHLAPHIKTHHKLNMSLDTCITHSKFLNVRNRIEKKKWCGGGRRRYYRR